MRHQHHSSSQHTCGRGRRRDTVRFHVGTPEGTRTLPYRSTSDCGDRVRSPHGGPDLTVDSTIFELWMGL